MKDCSYEKQNTSNKNNTPNDKKKSLSIPLLKNMSPLFFRVHLEQQNSKKRKKTYSFANSSERLPFLSAELRGGVPLGGEPDEDAHSASERRGTPDRPGPVSENEP